MRMSQFFSPTLRDNPKEAEVLSHRYMMRAGMIEQTSRGIYAWLPLGLRVLKKIESLVRSEMDAAGAQEILMPTIQPADLWRESGRYDDYGAEMLRIRDRHEREMLYSPTCEEMVTALVRRHLHSYRDLPRNLYHIQWKFRDEIRPRFGVLRGREFLMKDAYSFDLTKEDAMAAYHRMFLAYLRLFARLGGRAIPMRAATGPIGGDLSHEFIVLAQTGESQVYVDRAWLEADMLGRGLRYDDRVALRDFYQRMTGQYAATDEIHNPSSCPIPTQDLLVTRGVEVGHIFYFGTKYSDPMGARVQGPDGKMVTLEMGSYGIGVSRLVAAIIEASHDDQGIIWPESVAPFHVGLLNLSGNGTAASPLAQEAYDQLRQAGVDVLFDDRDERAGVKLADMDLIGLPWQLLIGERGAVLGRVELKNRATGQREEMSFQAALAKLAT